MMTIKKKRHRLLSILLCCAMLVGLLPTMALAENGKPDASNVFVNGNINFYDATGDNADKLYYKNGATDTIHDAEGYNAHYDPAKGVLTLNNYNGKDIRIGGTTAVDITIKLIGTNIVTGSVLNTVGGNITIIGSGSLTITNNDASGINVYGIASGYSNFTTGNVTIKENAAVTVNTTNNYNGSSATACAFGIFARENITISDNASVNITCSTPNNSATDATCYGMYTGGSGSVTIDTRGTIKVDVKNAGTGNAYSYGIYSGSNPTLTKVGSMEVEWKTANSQGNALYPNGSSFSTSDHAVNIDNTNCYASYRYCTPYEVTVTNGYLTGPGVKYQNGSDNFYFLAGDKVILNAPNRQVSSTDTTNIPFVKWVSKDVTITNSTNQSGASFTMPNKDVAVMAQYNPFTVQPKFTRESASKGTLAFTLISNDLSSLTNLYSASDLETPNNKATIQSDGLTRTATLFASEYSAGEYVVAVEYNGTTYYSEPFTVNYSATPETKPATAISLDKTTATLTVGGEETLTATVTPADSTDTVTWESNNTDVATVTNGKVTAVSAGTAVITAKAGDKTASCNVTVNAAPVTHPAKPTINVTGTYTYNGSEQTATVTGYDPATMDITGNTGKNAGDYTVSVTSKTGQWADGSTDAVTKTWRINKGTMAVESPTGLKGTKGNTLSTVTLPSHWEWKAPDTVMNEAGIKTFKAKYTPANTNYNVIDNKDVTVEVTDPASATEYDITVLNGKAYDNSTGAEITKATAGTVVKVVVDTDAMTAMSSKFAGWFALSGAVTFADATQATTTFIMPEENVEIAAAAKPVVTSLTLNKTETTLKVGGTETLIATVDPDRHKDNVQWSSNKETVATVTESGEVKAIAVGTATITAQVGDTSATCTVKVEAADTSHTHNLTLVSAKAATCTENGNKAYYKCDGCDKWFKDASGSEEITDKNSVVLAANGHTEGTEWRSDEHNHWHVCTVEGCGAVIESSKAAHIPDRTEATETEPIKCTVCEYVITPALGHTHNADTAFDYDETNHWNNCTGTGCSFKLNINPHEFEWKVDSNATATTDGSKHEECKVCHYAKAAVAIPATGYTITFDAKGGTAVASANTAKNGKLASIPATSRSGYTFDGWYDAESGGNKVTTDTVFTSNSTVYAHWTYRSSSSGGGGGSSTTYYTLTFNTNGGSNIAKVSKAKGTTVNIDEYKPTREGYEFTGWYSDKDLTDKLTSVKLAKDTTVYAGWKAIEKEGTKTDVKKTVIKMQINSNRIFVDSIAYEKDASPVIRNERTLVPIRFITESLGGSVEWNDETKEVTLTIDGKEIKMTIGKTLEKYGVAPVIINDRTFVPVRFVADELGAEVQWNDETKTVTVIK